MHTSSSCFLCNLLCECAGSAAVRLYSPTDGTRLVTRFPFQRRPKFATNETAVPTSVRRRPLCRKEIASRCYSRKSFERNAVRSTRSVEFPKVALLARRVRTRRRWTTDATATATTCSREQNPSSRISSARRTPGFQSRVRALHGVVAVAVDAPPRQVYGPPLRPTSTYPSRGVCRCPELVRTVLLRVSDGPRSR